MQREPASADMKMAAWCGEGTRDVLRVAVWRVRCHRPASIVPAGSGTVLSRSDSRPGADINANRNPAKRSAPAISFRTSRLLRIAISVGDLLLEDPPPRPHRGGGARAKPASPDAWPRPRDPCGAARVCGSELGFLSIHPVSCWRPRVLALDSSHAAPPENSSDASSDPAGAVPRARVIGPRQAGTERVAFLQNGSVAGPVRTSTPGARLGPDWNEGPRAARSPR